MKTIAILTVAALAAPMAAAQDLPPAMDAAQIGHGQVLSGMTRGHAQRGYTRRSSGVTQRQIAACAQKSRFRAEYGASHPKVRQLYSLCRGIGR